MIYGVFGRVSFETFWLNLVMVPLLGEVVLPFCPLALCTSILYMSQPTLMPLGRGNFQINRMGNPVMAESDAGTASSRRIGGVGRKIHKF